jgi:hypothetical protein
MRQFRLLVDGKYFGYEKGQIFNENEKISDNNKTVRYYRDLYPDDWEEVFEKDLKEYFKQRHIGHKFYNHGSFVLDAPDIHMLRTKNPLHKDEDLGYMTLEIIKSVISISPYQKKDPNTTNEMFVKDCISLAKELIKQLDEERK